jgi:hypothetical protein
MGDRRLILSFQLFILFCRWKTLLWQIAFECAEVSVAVEPLSSAHHPSRFVSKRNSPLVHQ